MVQNRQSTAHHWLKIDLSNDRSKILCSKAKKFPSWPSLLHLPPWLLLPGSSTSPLPCWLAGCLRVGGHLRTAQISSPPPKATHWSCWWPTWLKTLLRSDCSNLISPLLPNSSSSSSSKSGQLWPHLGSLFLPPFSHPLPQLPQWCCPAPNYCHPTFCTAVFLSLPHLILLSYSSKHLRKNWKCWPPRWHVCPNCHCVALSPSWDI